MYDSQDGISRNLIFQLLFSPLEQSIYSCLVYVTHKIPIFTFFLHGELHHVMDLISSALELGSLRRVAIT